MRRRQVLSVAAISLALPGCVAFGSENESDAEDCPRLGENPIVCEPKSDSNSDILFYPERDLVEKNAAMVDLVLENESQQPFNYDDLRVYGRGEDDWEELLSGTVYQGQKLLPSGELQTWSLKIDADSSQTQYEYGDCDSIRLSGTEYEEYAFALGGKLRSAEEKRDYVAILEVADQ